MTGIRQTLGTLLLTLVTVADWAAAPLAVAEDRWIEGQHYQTLTPACRSGPQYRRRGDRILLVRLWSLLHL